MASGWRLPAVALAVALIALVAFARSGMHERPAPAPTEGPGPVSPSVVPVALATSSPPTTTATMAPVFVRTPSELEYAYSPWPDRYADGIPQLIDGTRVLRLNSAFDTARLADGAITEAMLVGGWYVGPPDGVSGCSAQAYEPWCRTGRLADTPGELGRGDGVAVDKILPLGAGPLVVRATARATCDPAAQWSMPAACKYELDADEIVWQGDELTDTGPIPIGRLLITLASAVDFNPTPFHEGTACRLQRPAQTYVSPYGDVELLFAFRSADERVAQTTEVLNGPPFGDLANDCARRPPLDGHAGWISRDNVLLRVPDYGGPGGDAVRRILDELSLAAE